MTTTDHKVALMLFLSHSHSQKKNQTTKKAHKEDLSHTRDILVLARLSPYTHTREERAQFIWPVDCDLKKKKWKWSICVVQYQRE